MHSYSIDTDERKNIIAYIAVISVVISMSLSNILDSREIPLTAPSTMALFGLLYKVFDLYLWKCKLIRKFKISKIPILEGKWEGKYHSVRRGEDKNDVIRADGEVGFTIKQTWTKINIIQESEKSTSCSEIAGISINDNMGIVLRYQYSNEASATGKISMHSHLGFNKLRYLPDKQVLKGDYFTDKDRRTYGTLYYEKEDKPLA